jgi:putative oxidoreductase
MAMGLLILRLVVGLTLAAHGAQKLFGWFGGHGLQGAAQAMEKLGFFPGRRKALFAGLAEVGGGVLLAVGLGTPVAAAGIVGVMMVAGVSAHAKQGFFLQKGGFEYTAVLGLAASSVAFTGPGLVSLDALVGLQYSGTVVGLAALLSGAAGGAVQLLGRRTDKGALQPAAASSARS